MVLKLLPDGALADLQIISGFIFNPYPSRNLIFRSISVTHVVIGPSVSAARKVCWKLDAVISFYSVAPLANEQSRIQEGL